MRVVACDVPSVAVNQNIWHLYGSKQCIGLAWQVAGPTETSRRPGIKGIKFYLIWVKIQANTVVKFNGKILIHWWLMHL